MANLLPSSWLPEVRMDRVICHWTAGAYTISQTDLEHYHFVIGGDLVVRRGNHSIADNVSTVDDDYAAHTLGANTRAIGVAVAAMAGAVQTPFSTGRYPMKKWQWLTMAKVCAELCRAYSITVGTTTVLQHGEVQRNLGRPQRGKWDCMVLPWDPAAIAVGAKFRTEVSRYLAEIT